MPRMLQVALLVAGILAVGGTTAWATGLVGSGFVGSDGSITACVNNDSGNLRIVDRSSPKEHLNSCQHNESVLTFDQQGQTGPAGPQGRQGPPGISAAFDHDWSPPGGTPVLLDADPQTIGSFDLPAGSFEITARAEFHNSADGRAVIGCFLQPAVGQGKVTVESGGVVVMPFVGTYQSDTPSEIDLQCVSDGGSVELNHFRAVSIQVASVAQN